MDRATLEAWARGEAAPSEAARALEGSSGGGGGVTSADSLPVPSPAPASSSLVAGNAAAAFDTAFEHAFTPPQGRQPANAELSQADFASSLYRRTAPAPELGAASAVDMRSGAAEVQSWAAAAAAAAAPQPNQVAELSEARRAYKALQATADAAKEVARRLKYTVVHDHPDDHRHVKWEASGGPGGAKAALQAKLAELSHAPPNGTPKHGEVHEHTRDDGTKQTRYLVTSRKAAPLDAKVTL